MVVGSFFGSTVPPLPPPPEPFEFPVFDPEFPVLFPEPFPELPELFEFPVFDPEFPVFPLSPWGVRT